MELVVERRWPKKGYTIGAFFVDSLRFHESMEDEDRGLTQSMPLSEILSKKKPGITAIPKGRYEVNLDSISPKFKNKVWAKPYGGRVPEIMNVKGYSGIRIHPMTTAADSEGCVGIGDNKVKGKIVNSQKRYRELMDWYLEPARLRGEKVWITIK